MNTTPTSYPAVTLQNPRHEAFALALAQGATPEAAYCAAGFSDNNRKARARELAQDPDIAARVAHLKTCLPHIDALRDRFAPSLLLMPETKEQMIAWLWQVMSGTRRILPLQFRAANLFCRLNGWHLQQRHPQPLAPLQNQDPSDQSDPTHPSPIPASKPSALLDQERQMLDHLNRQTIAADLTHRPLPAEQVAAFYSIMADTALLAQATVQDPTAAEPAPATPPNSASPSIPTKSPSNSPQPQPVSSPQSPNGDKIATPAKLAKDLPLIASAKRGPNGDKTCVPPQAQAPCPQPPAPCPVPSSKQTAATPAPVTAHPTHRAA